MALLPDRIEEFEIFNDSSNGHKELNLNFYNPIKECFLGLEPRKYLNIAHEGDPNLDIVGKKFWKLRTDALYARIQLVKDNVQFQLGNAFVLLTHAYLLIHTHSLTHAYSHTHALTHLCLLTHTHTYLLTYLLTHSLTHSLTYLLTYLLTHSLTHFDNF